MYDTSRSLFDETVHHRPRFQPVPTLFSDGIYKVYHYYPECMIRLQFTIESNQFCGRLLEIWFGDTLRDIEYRNCKSVP